MILLAHADMYRPRPALAWCVSLRRKFVPGLGRWYDKDAVEYFERLVPGWTLEEHRWVQE